MDYSLSQVLTAVSTTGEFIVLALALLRGLWRQLPGFTAYLVLVLAADAVRWATRLHAGDASRAYAWTYWITQAVLVMARATAVADICRAALGYYRGVWQLARWLLALSACALLGAAAVRTTGSARISSYVIFVERELEFAIVAVFLLLLLVMRYYAVAVDPPLGGLIFGLVFYSTVVIFSTSVLTGPLTMPWSVYSSLRITAFVGALGCWGYALRRPLLEIKRPALSSPAEFEQASGAVDQRMRELNARLLQLMKR
jgi:hypothetical protein